MKQIFVFFLTLIVIISFFGCGISNSSSSEPAFSTTSSQSSPVPSSPPSSSESTQIEILIVGDLRADVDFLTDEQWTLYDDGLIHLSHFMFDPRFIGEDTSSAGFDGKINIDGWQYYPYYSEKYPNYDAFYQDMLTIYTPELFETLNHTMKPLINEPAPPIYLNVDGGLYYLDCNGSANLTHLRNWDRFELVSVEDDRIEFNLVAYYCERDDVSLENPIPVEMKRGPIVMEKTGDGWRISKFDYPN